MKKIFLCVPLLLLCCACNRHTKEEVQPLTEEYEHHIAKKDGAKDKAHGEKEHAPTPAPSAH